MLIFKRQADLSTYLQSVSEPKSIGLVPTMGALHEGHLSLLSTSLENNSLTVISIFVNPTQFNNVEDLAKYPRTIESDIAKIAALNPDIIIYTPEVDDIYKGNPKSEHFDFDGLEHQMEGKFRAGHFDGVGTIVKRLFEIIAPNNAYFGEKDFQQLQIVKKLSEKYGPAVNVVGCSIFRENNGLAMSSRNERLSSEEKNKAAVIYQTLIVAKEQFGIKTVQEVAAQVESVFSELVGFELEYFEIADEVTLKPIDQKMTNKRYRAFIAVFVNNIRLIDTISLN